MSSIEDNDTNSQLPENSYSNSEIPVVCAKDKRSSRKNDEDLEKIKMVEGRADQILTEISEVIKDDEGLADCWKDIVEGSKILYNGKKHDLIDMMKYLKEKTKLPSDMTTADVRSKELELGNLLQTISTELTLSAHARDLFSERKKDFLAVAKDKRKTQAVIEAELATFNEEFRFVRGIYMSSDLNYKFWKAAHEMVMEALERVKNVGITLATEAKVDKHLNQSVP